MQRCCRSKSRRGSSSSSSSRRGSSRRGSSSSSGAGTVSAGTRAAAAAAVDDAGHSLLHGAGVVAAHQQMCDHYSPCVQVWEEAHQHPSARLTLLPRPRRGHRGHWAVQVGGLCLQHMCRDEQAKHGGRAS